MPEGHTIHRAARLQRRRFAGEVLNVDSPQGRFSDGAAELNGRRLEGVDALGKHLFHRWEGDLTVHIISACSENSKCSPTWKKLRHPLMEHG